MLTCSEVGTAAHVVRHDDDERRVARRAVGGAAGVAVAPVDVPVDRVRAAVALARTLGANRERRGRRTGGLAVVGNEGLAVAAGGSEVGIVLRTAIATSGVGDRRRQRERDAGARLV